MPVEVRDPNGNVLELDYEPSLTIDDVKERVQADRGIPTDQQRLIYGGKQLEDGRHLSDYNIHDGSRIDLVLRLRRSQPQRTPRECVSLDKEDVKAAYESWENIAQEDDFDDDLCIVDPHAHYARLRALQEMVIRSSEWYRCQGFYDLADDDMLESAFVGKPTSTPEWMWSHIQDGLPDLSEDLTDEFTAVFLEAHQTLRHIWKSYLIMCRVLDSFKALSAAEFCTSGYSFLLKHADEQIAEVVHISVDFIDLLKTTIELFTVQVDEDEIGPHRIESHLQECLEVSCSEALSILRFSPDHFIKSSTSVTMLCRMMAHFLDLALVSYVGSHGIRFDQEFLQKDSPRIQISDGSVTKFELDCSLQRLACLDEFIDRRQTWVFQAYTTKSHSKSPPQPSKENRLSILSRMKDFADLWGPIWSVPADEKRPDYIKQYETSNGIIFRVSARPEDVEKGIIKCHWSSWAAARRRQESHLVANGPEYLMHKNDLLLIGIRFRINESCKYTIDNFQSSFGDEMGVLGTSKSKWRTDGRTATLGFSKLFGFQVQASQKLVPETTLKQLTLDKWTKKPERANPGILNQLLGVEISHCTGNAHRVSLKNMMLKKEIWPILNRQVPNWFNTTWGLAFLKSLRSSNPDEIFNVWRVHCANRREMAELVCTVLEILDTTGMRDDKFVAGFLHDNQECSVSIDTRLNDWTKALRDSPVSAVYAFVNESCIECFTADHRTAVCDSSSSRTVLLTNMVIPTPVHKAERIKLEPSGQSFNVVSVTSDTLTVTTASTPGMLFSSSTAARELRDAAVQGAKVYKVYVEASVKSHNGVAAPKDRTISRSSGSTSGRVQQLVPPTFSAARPSAGSIQTSYISQQEVVPNLQPIPQPQSVTVMASHVPGSIMHDLGNYSLEDLEPMDVDEPTTRREVQTYVDDLDSRGGSPVGIQDGPSPRLRRRPHF